MNFDPSWPREDALQVTIIFATAAHGRQVDKGGLPYILHPLAVMLSMPAEDLEGRMVALLHDVIEDTEQTLENLREYHFPEEIVAAVDAISKRKGETNREYWARCKSNEIARRVKIKDMEHNCSLERISVLPYSEQEYLQRKYAEALEFFMS